MIVCSDCALGPFDGRALYRAKGSLFHKGKGIHGKGPLFCAECAPDQIKAALLAHSGVDPEMKLLAARQRVALAA